MTTIASTQAPAKRTVKAPVKPKMSPKELGKEKATVKAPAKAKAPTKFQKLTESYRMIKAATLSLGGARKFLLDGSAELDKKHKLTDLQINILKASKSPENYPIFQAYVDRYKRGANYSPWYIVLTLNKYEEELQKQFKF